jgi:hypothetical protein
MSARFVVVVTVIAAGIVASCSDSPTDQPCTGIPEGGCPLSHGVACEDPACKAAYACRPGNVWELDHECPPKPPPPPVDANVPEAEAGPAYDANLDAPPGAFGGPGCGPLELPDCELGLVLLCASGCCDCEDLYVCQNGGWDLWGTCSADGGVRQR